MFYTESGRKLYMERRMGYVFWAIEIWELLFIPCVTTVWGHILCI